MTHYSGEWQERVHCGCTMMILPLELVDMVDGIDLPYWTEQIKQAQTTMRKTPGSPIH